MNTAAAKTLVLTVAVAVGAGLVAHVAWFLAHRAEVQAPVSREFMEKTLGETREIPQRVQDVVDFAMVKRGVGREFDWSGKPPPPPPPKVEVETVNAAKVADPLSKYLTIRGLKVDAVDPGNSDAFIKYTSDARVTLPPAVGDGTVLKKVGDRLDGDILSQVKVVAILAEGVRFKFINDPQRDEELVSPGEYSLNGMFRQLADGDVIVEQDTSVLIPRRPDSAPLAKTLPISPNKFRIGFEDAQEIGERYDEILTQDLGYRRHRDPVTRQPDGIEITSVKAGSIAARHGVRDGDVIKSINGHAVSSEQEAIKFVKDNKDAYDVWEVEVWNRGQTRTVTYYPPKK